MQWLAVALGGAVGALGRHAIVAYLVPVASDRFPWGTLMVNVLGCFLAGIAYVMLVDGAYGGKPLLSPEWRSLLMTGFLGAFTTFSAFALEAVQLWQYDQPLNAVMYIGLSVFACVAAAGAALTLTSRVLG